MIEVEVKVRVPDSKKFLKAIKRMDGEFLGEVIQEDTYYSHPSRDFSERDEALRVRREGSRTLLTYKGPRMGTVGKSREEVEVEVRGDVDKLLRRLGFSRVATVRKRRASYRIKDVIVYLDEVEGLGLFAEAEVKGDVEREGELLELLREMGGGVPIRKSYLEMLIATL